MKRVNPVLTISRDISTQKGASNPLSLTENLREVLGSVLIPDPKFNVFTQQKAIRNEKQGGPVGAFPQAGALH